MRRFFLERIKHRTLAAIIVGSIVLLLLLLLLLKFQVTLGTVLSKLMRESWPTMTPLEMWFDTARIRVEDLPSGWHMGSAQIRDRAGAEARFYTFYGTADPDQTWVNVSQEIALYSDAETAASSYDEWVTTYTDRWFTPPELEVVSQADQMHIACFPGRINGLPHYTCEATELYDKVVIVLGGNVFEDRWLTMEDFRTLIEKMDQRVALAVEDTQ